MTPLRSLSHAFKALFQLGPGQVGLYALHRLGLLTGHYRRLTSPARLAAGLPAAHPPLPPLFPLPSRQQVLDLIGADGLRLLLVEADEIASGRVRLFGASPVPLDLAPPAPLAHWTAYETGRTPLPNPDPKYTWEPARFGWVFPLCRAWHLAGDERHARAFWDHFERFTEANPPGLGPNWVSGQEVALRLMALLWAGQVFAGAACSTPQRLSRLAGSAAAHAARIPPTLVYARSQHNNHLLSEAAGLVTAGLALAHLPQASGWLSLGWRWLNRGLQAQIDGYGEYAQHSSNYHRLVLQLVLWVDVLLREQERLGQPGPRLRWPRSSRDPIRRSIHWLLSLLDAESGRVPNLGANDGAYLFPLSPCPFADHRPVLHAAARLFLEYDLPAGPWDEMSLWFGVPSPGSRRVEMPRYLGDQLYARHSWACLRTAQFNSRPSHADQLHLDLWWRGLNVACDAGTYRYTADPLWDNALAAARVHNTVTVDGRDQFTRAGRFLYLDWFNAYRRSLPAVDPGELQRVRGRYRAGNFRHTRLVSVWEEDCWRVVDEILPLGLPWRRGPASACLHWLLPDWPHELETGDHGVRLRLHSPLGLVELSVEALASQPGASLQVSLVRAGVALHGAGPADPIRGWTSPTYGVKIPALSLAVEMRSRREITFTTHFTFPASHPTPP